MKCRQVEAGTHKFLRGYVQNLGVEYKQIRHLLENYPIPGICKVGKRWIIENGTEIQLPTVRKYEKYNDN
jgi:hypothetical protein